MDLMMNDRPTVLITGASRLNGIATASALKLSENGWNIALTYWRRYDESMRWGSKADDLPSLIDKLKMNGAEVFTYEADLSKTGITAALFDEVETELGMITGLILSHCYSVDSSILTTGVESFDRHFSINTRASWLLIKEFGTRFSYDTIPGRIIALTSDHTVHNLPYGASKGALDRIVLAAAEELRDKHITANVINPGANDTGWMDEDFKNIVKQKTFQNRIGTPRDTANLVNFLCSEAGEWINGQLICSDGGVHW